MQNIVIDKPYVPVPPNRRHIWQIVLRTYLPRMLRKSFGIVKVDFVHSERLQRSVQQGHGVLLAPNHCRDEDPLVIGMLTRTLKQPLFIMASWHLFMQSRFQRWLLPRAGAFSIYREGIDRWAINFAIDDLANAERPLIMFAEGHISRTNDQLNELMDGVSTIARMAAKRRSKMTPPKKVVVHPIAVRYKFLGDPVAASSKVLGEIEQRLSWRVLDDLPLEQRISKVGEALLTLKEMEYMGGPQTGPLSQRVANLAEAVLAPLESEWTDSKHDGTINARVKRLRTAILPDMVKGTIDEKERKRRWKHLADVYLAMQLEHYPPDYVRANPTPARIFETVERFEEDLTDKVRVHGPMAATVTIGEAIEVNPQREGRGGDDPLLTQIADQLKQMLGIAPLHRIEMNTATLIARIVLIVIGLAVWFFTQHLLARRGTLTLTNDGSIRDGVHRLTERWYQRLAANPRAANTLLIISSLIMDMLGIYVLASAIFGATIQPFVGLLIVFGLRQICQALCPLPPPAGIIWRSPGFPTLLVTYKTDNDMFFSGHTAMAVFGTLCLGHALGPIGIVLGIAIAIFEIVAVLILRAHYTMDVFTGAIAALWAYQISIQIAPMIDQWIARITG